MAVRAVVTETGSNVGEAGSDSESGCVACPCMSIF